MYRQVDMSKPAEKLAHVISEIHNDSAPLGWEQYIGLAGLLIEKFGMEEAVRNYEVTQKEEMEDEGIPRLAKEDSL